jgi:hypothetical protein
LPVTGATGDHHGSASNDSGRGRYLLPDRAETHRLMEHTFLFGEFLATHVDSDKLPSFRGKVLMHAHCHHKAIIKKAEHEQQLLKKMGAELRELTSGCCGMAGSFGFEKDKYRLSVQVGEHSLLPAVRRTELSTVIVADGFSCREQVSQLSNRHALHFAEVLKLALDGDGAWLGVLPERELVASHEAVRRSKNRTLTTIGVILGAAGALAWALRKD